MQSRVLDISTAATTPHPLRTLVDIAIRQVRRLTLSPAQRRLLHLVEYGADTIGAPLLAAEDREDLDLRLDEAALDPRLHRFEALVASDTVQFFDRKIGTGATAQNDGPVLGLLLGEGVTAEDRTLARLMDAWVDAVGQLVAQASAALGTQVQRVELLERLADPAPVLLMIQDAACPAPLRRGLIGTFRAEAALLAAIKLKLASAKAPAWLCRALAEVMVEGRRAHLGYVVGWPGVAVDLTGLGVERLDLPALHQQYAENRARLDAIARGPSDTPFGEPILDD